MECVQDRVFVDLYDRFRVKYKYDDKVQTYIRSLAVVDLADRIEQLADDDETLDGAGYTHTAVQKLALELCCDVIDNLEEITRPNNYDTVEDICDYLRWCF